MGGIAGIFHRDGHGVDPKELGCMQQALAHRGPDGTRVWHDGPMGLVYLRLKIDPQPPQPFIQDGIVLIFDGRIDNLSLLDRLIARANRSPSPSPLRREKRARSVPEVVVAAYEQWGTRWLHLLLGDFAFALWDAQSKRLILARDPIGVKPLFYFKDEGRLIFASEAKGILAVSGVPCEPDEVRFAALDRGRSCRTERTFFKSIHRLLPGELLELKPGYPVRREVFYQFNPDKKIRMPSRDAYRRRFQRLFLEAVRCRLPNSGSVAFSLSGGLDSSSVVGAASHIKKMERPGIHLFALSLLSRKWPDERQYSQIVCKEKGIEGHPVFIEEIDLLKDLKEIVAQYESPTFDSTQKVVLAIYKAAYEQQARVILTGDWGDQVLTSMAYLGDMLRKWRLRDMVHEYKGLLKNEGGSPRVLLKRTIWSCLFPNGISDRISSPWQDSQNSRLRFRLAHQRELYDGVMLNLELREGLERMAALEGLEVRIPFLDRRLIEFLLAIPYEERIHRGVGKRLLRESLHGILPDPIAKRRDKGGWEDLVYTRLREAGLGAHSDDEADRLWDRRVREVWEESWIQEKRGSD